MVLGRNLRILTKMRFVVADRSGVRYPDILVIDAKTYVAEVTLATEVVLIIDIGRDRDRSMAAAGYLSLAEDRPWQEQMSRLDL